MGEATTARILHEGKAGETVTVMSSKQGLVIVVQSDTPDLSELGTGKQEVIPLRWEVVLDILPTIRGRVEWANEEIGDFPGVMCPICEGQGVSAVKFKGEPNNAPTSLSEILNSTNPISSYILHLLDHLGALLLTDEQLSDQ